MVQPTDAAAGLLGIETRPDVVGGEKAEFGRLFSSILLIAGRDGCTCRTCELASQLAAKMVEQAESPFPAPAAAGATPQPESPPPAPAPAAPLAATAPAPPPPPPAVNSERPGA